MAGSYSSSVNLPALHSRGYVYVAQVPVPNTVREGQTIRNVNWNWNVQGWPRGLQVYLCQASDRCIDVSRVRRGSTARFHGFLARQPLYFELKLAAGGPSPVAGQLGQVTVSW
nr:flagellar protein FlhE [Pseudomonas sp. S25]